MIGITAQEVAQATGGKHVSGLPDKLATAISTDTRKEMPGALFVALVGENFDAHYYLDKAVAQGAQILLCRKVNIEMDLGDASVVLVEDTLKALQKLAAWYRDRLKVHAIGITGSNGKTSTKDFTKAVLGAKFPVNATLGNLNNHIGLPLTVLATEQEHQAGVWEMGMNHPGEIAPLCAICKPKIGIITNVGTAHIEFMGTQDAIAHEKGALARSLPSDGVLVVPADCKYNDKFRSESKAKVIEVGGEKSEVRAEALEMNAFGSGFELSIEGTKAKVTLPVVGQHMVTNALLAAAVGYELGMSVDEIAKALCQAELTSGRLRSFEANGVRVIDDTYNANPESVRAAIDTLANLQIANGTRYVVLGKMGELGKHASEAYLSLGRHASQLGLHVVSVGEEAKEINEGANEVEMNVGKEATHFDSVDEAATWLKSQCGAGDAVLFKGSRMAAMEKVMEKAFID